MRTRIKICCIQNIEEAFIAIESGADALGLVARMPSGPGPISDELIREAPAEFTTGISAKRSGRTLNALLSWPED